MISILCKYKDTKTWISSDLRNLILINSIPHFLFLLKMKCLLFVNVCNFVDFFKMYYTYVLYVTIYVGPQTAQVIVMN